MELTPGEGLSASCGHCRIATAVAHSRLNRGLGGQLGRLLLDHGADPNLPEEPLQARPLAFARAARHEEIAALLTDEA